MRLGTLRPLDLFLEPLARGGRLAAAGPGDGGLLRRFLPAEPLRVGVRTLPFRRVRLFDLRLDELDEFRRRVPMGDVLRLELREDVVLPRPRRDGDRERPRLLFVLDR